MYGGNGDSVTHARFLGLLLATCLSAACTADAGEEDTGGAVSDGQGTSEDDGGSGDDGALVVIPCAELVAPEGTRCIEGGSFVDETSGPRELHELETFYMDTTEVTVAAYQACVDAGVCFTPDDDEDDGWCNYGKKEFLAHPVNCVNAYDAAGYCAWIGRRLPTEWEWEWAARGRVHARPYLWGRSPWGASGCWSRLGTCDVTFTAEGGAVTVDGLVDIAGNVWEWTDSDWQYGTGMRVLRGGAWTTTNDLVPTLLRTNFRFGREAVERAITHGFRCVEDPPKQVSPSEPK